MSVRDSEVLFCPTHDPENAEKAIAEMEAEEEKKDKDNNGKGAGRGKLETSA